MRTNEKPKHTLPVRVLFGCLCTLLFSGIGCLIYFWCGPVVFGKSFASVAVISLFVLLLWPARKHWRGLRHDVFNDPRAYLVILVTIVLTVAAMLGMISDLSPATLRALGLGVLTLIAMSLKLGNNRQDRLIEEIRLLSRNASAIRSFTSWHDPKVEELIRSARDSIAIVDSYFMESQWLGLLLQDAIDRGARKLSVSVYTLDPALEFGGQRLREQERECGGKIAADYEAAFHRTIRASLQLMSNHLLRLEELGVSVTTYFYRTMPGQRIFIIDDKEFIFGSFPLGKSNPAYACYHIPDRSLTVGDMKAVEGFRGQFSAIHTKESRRFDITTYLESAEAPSFSAEDQICERLSSIGQPRSPVSEKVATLANQGKGR